MNQTRAFIFAIFIILLLAFSAFSQTPAATPPPVEEDDVIKVESRLVVVPVSVLDARGEPVLGLQAQDFRLAEENRLQQIEQVSTAENVPLEIALLIDVSSSTNKIFELEKSAAAQFLQGVMRPEDRATIFLISNRPVLMQGRETAEKTAISVRNITPATKITATAFYDSVIEAARYLSKNAPQRSRRVILTLTDGEDNFSEMTKNSEIAALKQMDVNKLTQKDLDKRAVRTNRAHTLAQEEVLRTLQNADTVFYALNPSGPSVRLNIASQRAQNALQRFANETGGTAFLPQFISEKNSASFEQKNIQILTDIFRRISNELRAQYLLQYYSEADFPNNKYVKLDVDLTNPQQRQIRARQGYFVKN